MLQIESKKLICTLNFFNLFNRALPTWLNFNLIFDVKI
jgi:hypothetical protein